ncbi:MAG: hypothetical protein IPK03_02800 [Bacteroidetes bacterium]|nr:hypothetical protein [Bacteroidota bacterium]
MYSPKVKSILITHQINIQSRYLLSRKLVNYFNHKFIKAFDEIWIPDNHESTHSGVLSISHIATTKKFIGIQSILPASEKKQEAPSIDYLIIISGPEPARSIFEKKILHNLRQNDISITILGGKLNHSSEVSIPSNVHYIPFADHEKIAALIYKSKTIICRAGYSTLMDIAHMNYDGNVILVATKGQTEQEYLALLHSSKPNHLAMSEKKFFTEFPNLKLA